MAIPEFTLEGKKALLIGAGRGIGKGIALVMAEAGADIAVSGLTSTGAESVAEGVRALGRRPTHADLLSTGGGVHSVRQRQHADKCLRHIRRHQHVPNMVRVHRTVQRVRPGQSVQQRRRAGYARGRL